LDRALYEFLEAIVAGYMTRAVSTVTRELTLQDLSEMLERDDFNVGDVMTSEFIYVRTDTKLTRVLQLMVDHRIRSVPVIDSDHRLAGIIARSDVLRALAAGTGGGA
jgi:CBS domain-containing protein